MLVEGVECASRQPVFPCCFLVFPSQFLLQILEQGNIVILTRENIVIGWDLHVKMFAENGGCSNFPFFPLSLPFFFFSKKNGWFTFVPRSN